tara:strand:+ start:4213 stop:4395 length:183 start_codon:yes stop_codon:yes gene_type:complete
MKEYKVDEIFKDIEGDPNNVNMFIPPEVLAKMGWGEGTKIKVETKDGQLVITEVKDNKDK